MDSPADQEQENVSGRDVGKVQWRGDSANSLVRDTDLNEAAGAADATRRHAQTTSIFGVDGCTTAAFMSENLPLESPSFPGLPAF